MPYFVWREGRPRWSPGRHLRARGWKAVDLKDADGFFLTLAGALHRAQALNVRASESKSGTTPPPSRKEKNPREPGFIYFLRVGELVKIGYSNRPTRRLKELRTAMGVEFDAFLAVRGVRADERIIHEALEKHRRHREWFVLAPAVSMLMSRSLAFGRIVHNGQTPHVRPVACDPAHPITEDKLAT